MIEELELLANKQRELECARTALNEAVKSAFESLNPLRQQMQDVIEYMKAFHEKEAAYIELSQQTSKDLVANIRAVGMEIEQTRELLNEGQRLSASAIEIPAAVISAKKEVAFKQQEKSGETGEQQVTAEIDAILHTSSASKHILEISPVEKEQPALDTPDASRFWKALEDPSLYTLESEGEDALVEIRIPAEVMKDHEALSREAVGGNATVLISYENYKDVARYTIGIQVAYAGGMSVPVETKAVFDEADRTRLSDLGLSMLREEIDRDTCGYEVDEMQEAVNASEAMDELLEDLSA